MSTSIVATHAFEPNSADQAFEMARRLVASRLLPKSVATPEAAFTIIVAGRELGMTAMQSLRGIHIIEGKPVLSADTMLALALRNERCEYFRIVETSTEVATVETKRKGSPEPVRMSFTIEEAKTAGLTGKDNWRKYAPAMLRARAIAACVRAVYPDVFLGTYVEGELADISAAQAAPVQAVSVTATVVDVPSPGDLAKAIEDAETIEDLDRVRDTIQAVKKTMQRADLVSLSDAFAKKKVSLTTELAPDAAPSEEVAAQ